MAKFNIPYETEREGQIDFFANYNIPYDEDDSVLVDNTDGVYNGNILEFKLSIGNLNKVLFQAIKYLSKMRIKGESVPATILLVDLNTTTMYVYKSQDYFSDIHKVYIGAASKYNEGFIAKPYVKKLNYSDMMQSSEVKKILKGRKNIDEMYMSIDIDENCIVGWAERYYGEVKTARKDDLLNETGGELRNPSCFKGLINPYTGKTNEKFKYLMDCLNDRLSKKDLGAFYTPMPYAKKAAELVQIAVDRVPEGNDYIILDRCAGTGNLEAALIGLTDKNGDDLIEHCIVSTYEFYEYKVLLERIGDKVREVIPPTVKNIEENNGKGFISNADAMSKEYIENPIIRQYVDDPKCTIILFENPPYHDETTTIIPGEKRNKKNLSYVVNNMKEEVKGVATNELANQFIWSAAKYYMRQPSDSYIVFSPIKYWKQYDFFNLKAQEAFLFNRKHFHATESAISCILWINERMNTEIINAKSFDICEGRVIECIKIVLKKVHKTASKLYVSYNFNETDESNISCGEDGYETSKKATVRVYMTDNVVGYLNAKSFNLNPLSRGITRLSLYHGHGCYILKDNYNKILPIWVAKHVPIDNWYEKDIYATTSDGGDAYTKDSQFLKSCLIYTCLSNQNKCLSLDGSDGRRYQNELCFDNDALALRDLNKYAADKKTALDDDENVLMELWYKILEEARRTVNYNPEFNYGVYQITKELNTFKTIGTGKSKKKVYDYPELNGDLDTLRTLLKEYYKSHITEKMFKYELLK